MSDARLRQLERELLARPSSLELRREQIQLLERAGRQTAALDAMDLAWRLGAGELLGPLRAGLDARALKLAPELVLRYVPGGPFAMGQEGFDSDAPLRLVELPGFYVSAQVVMSGLLEEWEGLPDWLRGRSDDYWRRSPLRLRGYDQASSLLAFLRQTCSPPGLVGSYRLISEAQWERVFRAGCLVEHDQPHPYGVLPPVTREPPANLEWTRDLYDPEAYSKAEGTAPPQGPADEVGPKSLLVLRGAQLPLPEFVSYREVAQPDGKLEARGGLRLKSWREPTQGIGVRVVFELEGR